MFSNLINKVATMKDSLFGLWFGSFNPDVDPPDHVDFNVHLDLGPLETEQEYEFVEDPIMAHRSAEDEMNELLVDPCAVEGIVRGDQQVVQVIPAANDNPSAADAVIEEAMEVAEEEEEPVLEDFDAAVADPVTVEALEVEKHGFGHDSVCSEDLKVGESVRVLLTPLDDEAIEKWIRRPKKAVKRKRLSRCEPAKVGMQRKDLVTGEASTIAKWKAKAAMNLFSIQLEKIPKSELCKYRKRQRLCARDLIEEASTDKMFVNVCTMAEADLQKYLKKDQEPEMPKLQSWNDIPVSTSKKPPALVRVQVVDPSVIEDWKVKPVEGPRLVPKDEGKKTENASMPILQDWRDVPPVTSSEYDIPTLERMGVLVPTTTFKTPEKLCIQTLSQPGTSRQSGSSHVQELSGKYSHKLLALVTRRSPRKRRSHAYRQPFRPLTVNGTSRNCLNVPKPQLKSAVAELAEVSTSVSDPSSIASLKPVTFVSIEEYCEMAALSDFQTRLDSIQPYKIWSEPSKSILVDVWDNILAKIPQYALPENFERTSSDFTTIENFGVTCIDLTSRAEKVSCTCARVIPIKVAMRRSKVVKSFGEVEVKWSRRESQPERHTQARIVIRKSPIHGRGMFTLDPIPKGKVITEYIGEVIRSFLCDVRERKYLKEGKLCYFFAIKNTDFVIDATVKGTAARYINHSCYPNCRTKIVGTKGHERVMIYAKKEIPANTELTYDYMFEPGHDCLPCFCGAKKCKKYM